MFDLKTLTVLIKNGYRPPTSVVTSDPSEEFLRHLGGMCIKFKRAEDFDHINVFTEKESEGWEDYEEKVGDRLHAVGTVYSDHMTLLVGQVRGEVYLAYDETFIKAGSSIQEAIKAILFEEEMEHMDL